MSKRFKKQPYSFSFSEDLINKLKYYKYTHINDKLSQQVEKYLDALIPDIK